MILVLPVGARFFHAHAPPDKIGRRVADMAILLEFNYGKRLGLPGYSSHNFGVSVKAEVNNPESIPGEAERVYSILQDSVDSQIVNPGFVPGEDKSPGRLDNDPAPRKPQPAGPGSWKCSQKQTGLILDILERNNLQLSIVDTLAEHLHGKPMASLNKLEASGVISEILERYGRKRNGVHANGGNDQ
jgi:hypothetical protein